MRNRGFLKMRCDVYFAVTLRSVSFSKSPLIPIQDYCMRKVLLPLKVSGERQRQANDGSDK